MSKRIARTNLNGRRALVTGGRAKIGHELVLMMLRDGAEVTLTTRFPADAVRRFEEHRDAREWLDRLHIVAVDLRDPRQVLELAAEVSDTGPLDILVNNAAQTIRRPASAYAHLLEVEEGTPLGQIPRLTDLRRQGLREITSAPHLGSHALPSLSTSDLAQPDLANPTVGALLDPSGLIVDMRVQNSWSQRVYDVDPLELLEVQLCNVVAPFLLVSQLTAALSRSDARRKYIVNVTATEGQFSRAYKGAGHPHTNMAKAALNMLTRTCSEDLRGKGILMTSVDTGWITDERPYESKARQAREGFRAPLDLIDGAARIYDPIVQGEAGVDLYNCLLKNYRKVRW